MAQALTILPYTDALARHFHAINTAWISAMFVLEPHDEHVLAHPREAIVDKGGVVLFVATPDGTVIGTGALMPTGSGAYELTKMGVSEAARGTGAGAFLLAALIQAARALPDLDTLYLLTSTKCEAAIHLYEKAGFVHDAAIMARFGARYARCDVAMRLPLPASRAVPLPARTNLGDRLRLQAGRMATPLGMLATGGLVAALLLAVPPIVRAARKTRG